MRLRHRLTPVLTCIGMSLALCLLPDAAHAEFADTFKTIVSWFDGNLGRGMATLAVIVIGLLAMFNKIEWKLVLLAGVGIAAMFSAIGIYNMLEPGAPMHYTCPDVSGNTCPNGTYFNVNTGCMVCVESGGITPTDIPSDTPSDTTTDTPYDTGTPSCNYNESYINCGNGSQGCYDSTCANGMNGSWDSYNCGCVQNPTDTPTDTGMTCNWPQSLVMCGNGSQGCYDTSCGNGMNGSWDGNSCNCIIPPSDTPQDTGTPYCNWPQTYVTCNNGAQGCFDTTCSGGMNGNWDSNNCNCIAPTDTPTDTPTYTDTPTMQTCQEPYSGYCGQGWDSNTCQCANAYSCGEPYSGYCGNGWDASRCTCY